MKPHYEVVGAVIFEEGKLLSFKRGASKYPYVAHKYEFAGGKVEPGERREDALKRELKEELDMSIEVESLFASNTFEYPDFSITLWVYDCIRTSDFALKEHESFAWLSPKDLDAKEWAPADEDVIGTIKRVFGE